MKHLVRQSGRTKKIGEESEIFLARSTPLSVGEEVEVIDPHGNVLNIATVTAVDDAQQCAQIVMIA